ncbi:hypothetical protein V5O48_005289 [Marasmius crinis-equi]|uniref:Laccase n=1 Tax=Marasmius crinis-equi TaxID=585013 RepID=A0ABR3FMP5_9AGAR
MKNFLHLLSTLLPAIVQGAVIQRDTIPITLDIENKDLAPDGFTRSTIVANGQYPGPAIFATKGDTLVVTVNNKLTDPSMRRSTSLNFDGIFFNSENEFEEGTPFVTQCPIVPNDSFTYTVPLGQQAGSFWYHSQLSVQYVDGLRGALIIYDPEDPHKSLYDVDDESTLIQLGDWWHNSSVDSLAFFKANDIIPVADSGTFNGVGRYVGGPELPFSIVNVEAGKRYRLRVINEAARSAYNFSIDSHNFTLIEADGENLDPLTANVVPILAGQRYSLVLEANQPVGNYWINAPFSGGSPTRNPNQNATLSRGILRYAGAEEADPTDPMTAGPSEEDAVTAIEAELRPLNSEPAPDADVTITFEVAFTEDTGGTGWRINNISYQSPEVPTLVKVLDGANEDSDFNVTEHTIILPANATVEVNFPPNDDDELHPFHLHGMNFWLVKSNSGEANTENPIRRDVVGVGSEGTTIRFRTDKPGPWFFHCHIMWHMSVGLGSVFLVDPEGTRDVVKPNEEWLQACPKYNALPADEK